MAKKKTNEITIDGVVYVPQTEYAPAKKLNGLKYVIVRTYSAGVFAGYLESRKEQEVVMLNARKLWYWSGAATLAELAMRGVSKPDECRFPMEIDRVELLQAIEILDCTKEAQDSIAFVPVWSAQE